MLNEKEKKNLQQRLKKVSGQINGIDKMIDDGRYCVDILQQILAARAALNQVALLILESIPKAAWSTPSKRITPTKASLN